MQSKAALAGLAFCLFASNPAAASGEPAKPASASDPNEKVCEDIVLTGSRLAKKRICATRAEWEDRRRQERMAIDNAQIHAADPCNTINTHSGGAAC